MNVLIGLIILSAFLQTSFVGANIVLLFLVCRSFIVESRMNYFLAFFSGLLISILAVQNLGFWALVFLIAVKIGHFNPEILYFSGSYINLAVCNIVL